MKIGALLSLSLLLPIQTVKAQISDKHACHVFVAEPVTPGTDVTLGRFDVVPKLNAPTTKSFTWRGRDLVVTATILYTERSLPLSKYSMTVGVVATKTAVPDAITDPTAAATQVSLEPDTFIVKVRQGILLAGKRWVVGVQCQTMTDEARQQKIQEQQDQ